MKRFIFLIIFTSQFVFADDNQRFAPSTESECTTVDYRNIFQLKARDQKKIAWCFAHASADNLQFQERTKTQISAADIAINFSHSTVSRLLNFFNHAFDGNTDPYAAEYGLAKIAINMIKDQGYCPESIFPSEDWTRIDLQGNQTKVEVAAAATEIYELQSELKKRQNLGENVKISDLPFYYSFNNVDKKTFANLLMNSKKNKLLDNMRNVICQGQRVPFKSEIDPGMFFGKNRIIRKLNTALDSRKPASLDFSSQVLKDLDKDKTTLDLHTVAVVGRKFDSVTRQCQYLLKDSYGPACDKYDPRIECDKGYLWIPENHLIKATLSVVVFK